MSYSFPKQPSQSQAQQQQQLLQLLKSNPQLMKKYQEQLEKLKFSSKNSSGPMDSQQYLKQLENIEKFLDEEGGLTIIPKQRLVLKFFDKRTNEKIFVNVVGHPVIDHPQQKLLVDFQNQPGLRIPMSMGRVREDTDKNGTACKTVDVVMNPKIIDTMETDAGIMGFTAQIIGNYLLEKYKIAVADDRMKKVKGLKYKGTKVQIQRVKGKKSPKIQQLAEQVSPQQQQQQEEVFNELHQKKQLIRPQFKVHAYNNDECEEYSLDSKKNLTKLKITLELPHLLNAKGIHLQASSRFIYLFVRGIYEICLKLPFEVSKYVSKFGKKERKLQIMISPLTVQSSIEQQPVKESKNIEFENDLLDELV